MGLASSGDPQDNIFIATAAANDFQGGSGNDTVSYVNSTAGVRVRLDDLTPTGLWPIDYLLDLVDDLVPDGTGGYAQGDDLDSIENVTGSTHGDRLHGNRFANTLKGLAGDDLLFGDGGNDVLIGDEGNDQLSGGTGDDTLIGGKGSDRLDGGAGFDIASYRHADGGVYASLGIEYFGGEALGDTFFSIEGLEGSAFGDTLIGGALGDTLLGGGGEDELFGNAGADTLDGGDGDDILYGGAQNDVLTGGAGADALSGGDHNDVLNGGEGNDWLSGESGDDILNGGAGTDVLFGGEGRDLFVMSVIGGHDTITDFVTGEDRVDLREIDAIAGGGDNAFTWIGAAEFSGAAGQLRVFLLNGNAYTSGDVNGDAVADFTFGTNVALTVSDFLL